MPRSIVVLCSIACLLYGVAPLCAKSSEEQAKALDHSIDLGGAIEDADVSPSGEYVSGAVRKCEMSEGSRTCTLFIEVWSSADSKRVANRTLLTNVGEVAVGIRFSADGRVLLVSDGKGKLRLWQTRDLSEINSIDLGFMSADSRNLQEKDNQERARLSKLTGYRMIPSGPQVMQIETSPSAPLVAVVISVGGSEIIRVFDLMSGELLHSWSFPDAFRARLISWSQDGKRIALFLPNMRGFKHPERTDPANLLIYDLVSGQLTAKFEIKEAEDLDAWAPEAPAERRGRVIFLGDDLIVSTRRTPDTFFRPTLRLLDSTTGRTIRTIGAEGTGVRDPIAASADGKVLLGFVGRVQKVMDRELNSRDVAVDTRICVWKMPAGKPAFTSEELPLIPNRASFRLNSTGNWIIGFDQGTKLLVLKLT